MRECDSVLYYIVTAYMHMMMIDDAVAVRKGGRIR